MRKPFLFLLLILGFSSCETSSKRSPPIGEAYAGPAALPLRKDIPLQSPVAATVHHGDKLEIVQHRRRFMKVRTASGVEGWTEDHLLLSSDEISALKEVERNAKTLPSQGIATTYDMLNVHTEPNRFSPSFLQIKEHEKFDVLGHVVAPRTPLDRKPLLPPRRKILPAHKPPDTRYPLPALPTPPPPPHNWRELSRTPDEVQREFAAEKAEHPIPTEDWSLVRNAKGQSGWVLTRRLFMAIPDDVAQYAEGHRITSYFSLGDVRDGDDMKHEWLWTTSTGEHPYDFDSFRVFIWNVRRHRYETAFIQRNVEGYFPVLLQKVTLGASTYPGFSVCLADDSTRVRRNYAFIVNVVRFGGQQPCEPPPSLLPGEHAPAQVASAATTPASSSSLYGRLKAFAKKLFTR